MNKTVWLFEDIMTGHKAAFTTKEKAINFIKQYGSTFFEVNGFFPTDEGYDLDYSLKTIDIDLDFESAKKFIFY